MPSLLQDNQVNLSSLSLEQIADFLASERIALKPEEALKIQNEILGRSPTMAELILWSIQGSEHCSYKSSRQHLNQFTTDSPDVILGPSEDAGIVEVARDHTGHRYGIVMSHESHNHPSQIVPYEGAATGIGGNVRDVSCMGAKVIATADPLRFGDITSSKTKWIADGVVSGIAGYGNPIGVPNIAGDVYFNESYNENCLVNVVTLGVTRDDWVIHSKAPKNAAGYDLILVGKPTDNSGFGGASFASLELDEEKKEQNKGAVQEPNAFLKRHLLKATYGLFDIMRHRKLLDRVGFKDLGAGGIACASVELADASGLGAYISIDDVFVGMDNLPPEVILCAETQERYMWVSSPDVTPLILEHYNKTFDLPAIAQGAQAKVIGKITQEPQFVVEAAGKKIVSAKACDVTRGLMYDRTVRKPHVEYSEPYLNPSTEELHDIALKVLTHENVASRAPIYERYDKNVQGISILEPGEADAGVMQPFMDKQWPEEIRKTGIALSVDQNPRYCMIDPYQGGVNAVVESMRNVAAVGASPIALTDCLNFGNPEKEEQMWQFAEGVRGVSDAAKAISLKHHPGHSVPIISGNVSLYNESSGKPIAPSPIIGCLGKLADVGKAISMHFKKTDTLLYMIGERKNELGGSVYYDVFSETGKHIPKPDLDAVQREIYCMINAIDEGFLFSAHDISDGGILCTLSEMSFKNEIGCSITIPGNLPLSTVLFSETGGFVCEVRRESEARFIEVCKEQSVTPYMIGRTHVYKQLAFNQSVTLDLPHAKHVWTRGLREKL